MAIRTYRTKLRLAGALALGGALVAGVLGGRIAQLGQPGEHFWLVFAGLLAIIVLAFAAALPWWRKLDHLQRDGHLISWYWGGMVGGVVVMMALIAAAGVRSDLAEGAGAVIVGQGVGFTIYFVAWHLRRRGPEA